MRISLTGAESSRPHPGHRCRSPLDATHRAFKPSIDRLIHRDPVQSAHINRRSDNAANKRESGITHTLRDLDGDSEPDRPDASGWAVSQDEGCECVSKV